MPRSRLPLIVLKPPVPVSWSRGAFPVHVHRESLGGLSGGVVVEDTANGPCLSLVVSTISPDQTAAVISDFDAAAQPAAGLVGEVLEEQRSSCLLGRHGVR